MFNTLTDRNAKGFAPIIPLELRRGLSTARISLMYGYKDVAVLATRQTEKNEQSSQYSIQVGYENETG
jgi:hypothetical protein